MKNVVYPVVGRQSRLPFYLTGIGISDPEYHVKRASGLVSHQILFTSSGRGVLAFGGREYIQQKGSVFYLPPKAPHEYYPEKGDWVTCWLVFRGEYAELLMKNIGFDGFFCADGCDTKQLDGLFRRMLTSAADPINGGENASVLLYEYILAAQAAMHSPESRRGLDRIASQAIIYMDANFMQDISDEALAALSGVSVQHFCRVFKAQTSMRPLEYLAKRRLARAKELLLETDIPIGDVGGLSGYPDRNYFSAVFKRFEGVSPREYRRSKAVPHKENAAFTRKKGNIRA